MPHQFVVRSQGGGRSGEHYATQGSLCKFPTDVLATKTECLRAVNYLNACTRYCAANRLLVVESPLHPTGCSYQRGSGDAHTTSITVYWNTHPNGKPRAAVGYYAACAGSSTTGAARRNELQVALRMHNPEPIVSYDPRTAEEGQYHAVPQRFTVSTKLDNPEGDGHTILITGVNDRSWISFKASDVYNTEKHSKSVKEKDQELHRGGVFTLCPAGSKCSSQMISLATKPGSASDPLDPWYTSAREIYGCEKCWFDEETEDFGAPQLHITTSFNFSETALDGRTGWFRIKFKFGRFAPRQVPRIMVHEVACLDEVAVADQVCSNEDYISGTLMGPGMGDTRDATGYWHADAGKDGVNKGLVIFAAHDPPKMKMAGVWDYDLHASSTPPSFVDREVIVGFEFVPLDAAIVTEMWEGRWNGEATTQSKAPFGLNTNVKDAVAHRSECAQQDSMCPLTKDDSVPAEDRCGANGVWQLVFRQTTPTFKSKAAWLAVNTNDTSSSQFSLLGQLEKYRGPTGKFELELKWPKDSGRNYQRWRQSSNPVTYTQGGVVGYEALDVQLYEGGAEAWIGLERSASTSALLDGDGTKDGWWFAVGAVAGYSGGKIPGNKPKTTTQVELRVCHEHTPSEVTVRVPFTQASVAARTASNRSIDVACLPHVHDRVYSDRGYTFKSLGDFASNTSGLGDASTGTTFYVRPPNEDRGVAAGGTMWTLQASHASTVYINVFDTADGSRALPGWLAGAGSTWAKQDAFKGAVMATPPLNLYVLGQKNVTTCPDKTEPVSQEDCELAARAVLRGINATQGRTNFLVSGKAGWDYIPAGCSVQSGGDFATHFNLGSSTTDTDGLHSLVCKKIQAASRAAPGVVYTKDFAPGTISIPGSLGGSAAPSQLCAGGVRSGVFCCAASCGVCGGSFIAGGGAGGNCEARKGGAELCCDAAMRRTCSGPDDVGCVIDEADSSVFVAFVRYAGVDATKEPDYTEVLPPVPAAVPAVVWEQHDTTVCSSPHADYAPPGRCAGNVSTSDFLGDNACQAASPCTAGQGDCDNDDDCLGGLLCGHRAYGDAMPPGVVASNDSHIAWQTDFCFESVPCPGYCARQAAYNRTHTSAPSPRTSFRYWRVANNANADGSKLSRPSVGEVVFYADAECTQKLSGAGATAKHPGTLCSGHDTNSFSYGCHRALDGSASTTWRPQGDCGDAECWLALDFALPTVVRCAATTLLGKPSASGQPDVGVRLEGSDDLMTWVGVARSSDSAKVRGVICRLSGGPVGFFRFPARAPHGGASYVRWGW